MNQTYILPIKRFMPCIYLFIGAWVFTGCSSREFDFRSEYSIALTVADAVDQFELEFGQHENASQLDQKSPPLPPEGALHAWFERSGEKWLKDFRGDHESEAGWELHHQAGSGETITLSWQTEAVKLDGSLTLTDETGSFQVDMKKETYYEFGINEHEYLVIEYRAI